MAFTWLTGFTVDGSVGIGTTSPQGLLHVSSETVGNSVVIIESDTDNNNENDNPQLQFKQDGGNTIVKAGITGDAGTIFTNSLGNTAYLGNDEAAALQLYTNATARLTIESGGDVGIGTNNPSATLEVSGNVKIGDSTTGVTLANSGTDFLISGVDTGGAAWNSIHLKADSLDGLYIQKDTNNVGIGTSTPGTKLEISDAGDALLELNGNATGNPYMLFSQAGTRRSFIQHHNTGDNLILASEFGGITLKTGTSGSEVSRVDVNSSGSIQFNSYDSTNNTGTPTYLLGTDASGNIVKTNTVPGSAAGPYLPLAGGTLTGPLTIADTVADPGILLNLFNDTNTAGATIRFSDNTSQGQVGDITFRHSDSASQGGGASFQFNSQPDTVLIVGNATNKGRVLVSSQASATEVDYGFFDDIDTGMRRSAANTLRLTAGGTDALMIDGSNNNSTFLGNLIINGYTKVVGAIRGNGQQIVLNAGESSSYATGQTDENVYINAEAGLQVVSSPDNWSTGWAGRQTAHINKAGGASTFPGTIGSGSITSTGTITANGNFIGNANNTTEVGSYSTGGIKRIRMTQGGELHFGDTTTTNFLGITEGVVNSFGDSDRLGIYYRNELKMYSNTNTLRYTIDASGNATFGGTINSGAITSTGTGIFDNMVTIDIDDISTGENRGLNLLNSNGTDQQWNITAGTTGINNDDFTVRNSTNNINTLIIDTTGNATFTGTVTADSRFVSSDTAVILSATGAGTVYLRPSGQQSATGQVTIASAGEVNVSGQIRNVTAGTTNLDAVNLQQLNNATTGVLTYKGVWAAGTTGVTSAATTTTAVALTAAPTEIVAVGDIVTGEGITGLAITVATVTSQTALVLSAAVTVASGVTVTFSPAGGFPDLTATVKEVEGDYYITNVAGYATPNDISTDPNEWAVGDWCIFTDADGTNQWQKLDNSSTLDGAGSGGSLAAWSGTGTSVTLQDAPITYSGNDITTAGIVIIDGGTGVSSTGVLQVRQDGDGVGNGIAITSSNSSSSRIWKNASGVLNLTGSTGAGVGIDTGGEVGIATPPVSAYKLSVLGTTRFDGNSIADPDATSTANYPAAHTFTHTSVDNGVAIYGGDGGFTGTTLMIGQETSQNGNYDQFKVIADTNGTPITQFLVKGSGNVSIGNTNNTYKLDVSGTGRFTDNVLIGTDITSTIPLQVNKATASGTAIAFLRNSAATTGNGLVVDVTNTPGTYIADFRIGNSTKVRIDPSGNVGIGTGSPTTAKLHVNGNQIVSTTLSVGTTNVSTTAKIQAFSSLAGGTAIYGLNYEGSGRGITGQTYRTAGTGTSYGVKGVGSNSGTQAGINIGGFFEAAGTGTSNYALITGAGDVGIGTGTPLSKLHINGMLNITGSRSTYVDNAEDDTANAHIFTTDALVGDFAQLAGSLVLQARVNDAIYRDIIMAGGLGTTADPVVPIVTVRGEGIVQFNTYDSTNNTGTPTYLLGTDANGDIVKTNTIPGSGAGPYLPLSAGTGYPLTGSLTITNTAAAHLILNGDSNNVGDAGDQDGIIDFLGDGGAYGYRINTENWSGATALNFQENINGSYTSRLFISKTGNVGIGTNNPLNKTHIVGPDLVRGVETSYALALSSSTTPSKTLILGYDETNDVGIIEAIHQQTAWKNLALAVSGNTNVGVGEIAPTAKLHIKSSGNATLIRAYAAGYKAMDLWGATNGSQLTLHGGAAAATILLDGRPGYNSYFTGNLGIGETNPGVKLQIVTADEQITNFSSSVVDKLIYSQINANSSTAGTITGAAAIELVGKANASGHGRHAWIGAEGTSNTTLLTKLKFKVRGQSASGYDWAGASEAPTIMTLEGDGNVGIGTTNPMATLSLSNSAAKVLELSEDIANGSRVLSYDRSTNLYRDLALEALNIKFNISGNEKMRVKSDGNVGINTTDPQAKLHVVSNTDLGDALILEFAGTSQGGPYQTFQYSEGAYAPSESGDLWGGIRARSSHGSGAYAGYGGSIEFRQDGGLSATSTPAAIVFNTTYSGTTTLTERMRILGSGNVGIGNTGPDSKLQVEAKNVSNVVYAGFRIGYNGTSHNYLDGDVQHFRNGAGTSTKMLINSSGNVSINNTSDTYKLDVTGTGRFSDDLTIYGATKNLMIVNTEETDAGIVFEDAQAVGSQTAAIKFNSSDNKLKFFVNDEVAQRMVIDTLGNVGINTTNPQEKLEVNGNIRLSADFSIYSQGDLLTLMAGGSGGTAITISDTSGNIGIGDPTPSYELDVSGTIRATGDVIAYSDARVKENVETIENALDKVTQLRGVSYTRNDVEDKTTKIGVIAQEVLEVLPEVVQQDGEGKYSVAYGNMVGLLIEAIKEQDAKIDRLEGLVELMLKTK